MLNKYLNIDYKQIEEMSDIWRGNKRKFIWNAKERKTEEQINEFYLSMGKEYLCDLHLEFLKNRDNYLINLPDMKGKKVLDFGCGTGEWGIELLKLGAEVDFYDIGEHEGIKFLRWNLEQNKYKADIIFDVNKLKEKYDFIICLDVLEHVKNPSHLFYKLYNKINDMGMILLTSPLIAPLYINIPKNEWLKAIDHEHLKEAFIDWDKNNMNDFLKDNLSFRTNTLMIKSKWKILNLWWLMEEIPYGACLNLDKAFRNVAKVYDVRDLNKIGLRVKQNGEGIKTAIKKLGINLLFQADHPYWFRIPKKLGIPTATYNIDTYMYTEKQYEKVRKYDYQFFAQERFAKEKNQYWIPLGVDTDIYKPLRVQDRNKYHVGFCGTILNGRWHNKRNEYLKELVENFEVYIGRDAEMYACKKYNESTFVFNYCIANDINMRIYEGMATGSVVLTNKVDGLEKMFKDREHLLVYKDKKDMINLIRQYLSTPDKLDEIRKAGSEEAKKHTYENRVIAMLGKIK